MAHYVKVADPDELPPGKGKTLGIEGHEVTIYNREGRYVATAPWPRHVAPPVDTACEMPGHRFDVNVEDSPARLHTGELHYQVVEREDGVYVLVEDGDGARRSIAAHNRLMAEMVKRDAQGQRLGLTVGKDEVGAFGVSPEPAHPATTRPGEI